MKPFRVLWRSMCVIKAEKLLLGWLAFLGLSCVFFCFWEPETFEGFGQAVWYCFQTLTTIGYGDIVAHTTVCRVLTIAVGLSSLFAVAVLTGVVVNFFNELVRIMRNESFLEFGHQLEHLSELPPDELKRLQEQFVRFKQRL